MSMMLPLPNPAASTPVAPLSPATIDDRSEVFQDPLDMIRQRAIDAALALLD